MRGTSLNSQTSELDDAAQGSTRPDPGLVQVIAPSLLEVHYLDPIPTIWEVPPDQARDPFRARERQRQVAGPRIAQPDRVVPLGSLRVYFDEADGVPDSVAFGWATLLDL